MSENDLSKSPISALDICHDVCFHRLSYLDR